MESIILAKPRATDWLRLYSLYHSAFPRAEKKPFPVILEGYRKGKMDIWCLMAKGRFSGLAITINGQQHILIDYLAVCPNRRGQGVGTGALKALRRHYTGKGVFLEIESTYEDAPNQAQRLTRKQFYLRCGLTPMQVMVRLFGVKMELLGFDCQLSFEEYHRFYRDNLGQWAADRILKESHPESGV